MLGGQWDHEAKGKVLGLLVRTPARCATAREEVMLPEQLPRIAISSSESQTQCAAEVGVSKTPRSAKKAEGVLP